MPNLLANYVWAPDLVITHDKEEPVLHVPSKHLRVKVDENVLAALLVISKKDLSRWADSGMDLNTFKIIFVKLVESGIIVDRDNGAKTRSSRLTEEWIDWGAPAWFMHLDSRGAKYGWTEEKREEIAKEFSRTATEPPPVLHCECGSESVQLPIPSIIEAGPFSDILASRRTCRNFSAAPLSRQQLGDLLFYTGGVLFTHETRYYGTVLKKTAPSPGARHATELYVLVQHGDETDRGIYHYCPLHHALTRVWSGDTVEFLGKALYNQQYFSGAGAVVFYVSFVDRIMWKYKNTSRIYRLMHYETAHYAQNFLLVGTALGLGVFVTGALNEPVIEDALQLDGVKRIAMYVTGAGHKGPGGPYRRYGVKVNSVMPTGVALSLPEALESKDDQMTLG